MHGARGSGKTSLAIEAVDGLLLSEIADAVFWYDFDQPKNRNGDQLIPALALHLMRTQGAFEPLEQFAYGGRGEHTRNGRSPCYRIGQGRTCPRL